MASPAENHSGAPHLAAAMDSESPRVPSRVIKFIVSLMFCLVAESRRTLRGMFGKPAPANAVVIYYHHVLDDQRESFSRQLDHLVKYAKPLRADLHEPLRPNGRYCMVTADDGWKSFADNAVPELARRNIPATIFAISERLGQSVDGITFDRLVSADELRGLDVKLVTIGSHTATHVKMTTLDKSAALRELRQSREQLRVILDREVTTFCFPYGDYGDALIPLCREAGYERVFTCAQHLADPSQFVLGRVRVDPTDWPLEFHLKLMGAYRWLPMAVALKRRLLSAIRPGSRVHEQSPEIPAA
jgi:peptidoglycan/xylan/chitin deacetylase (PgdA/CDA1 family)